jgi:hypothetical protein
VPVYGFANTRQHGVSEQPLLLLLLLLLLQVLTGGRLRSL